MYIMFSLILKGSLLTSAPDETSLCAAIADNILKTDYTNQYFLKHGLVICLWFNNRWKKKKKKNQALLKTSLQIEKNL